MEPVPRVGWGFSPLDEQLELLPGSLTPTQEEHLVRLSAWMPFRHAIRLLGELMGVQISEASARRHTQQAGTAYEQVQTQQSQMPAPSTVSAEPAEASLALSSDGAYVPLLHGQWAEVRTLAIGTVQRKAEQIQTRNLSYFSRMTDAATFLDRLEVETRRRGLTQAPRVCAVMDGADWLQGLIDLHRPDAVRILDFPHAAQRFSASLDLLRQAGHRLAPDAVNRVLHRLGHQGPLRLLHVLHRVQTSSHALPALEEALNYLQKRQALMDYPTYCQDGWPIGSGMVESANKTVMQARLKGAGMRFRGDPRQSLVEPAHRHL
jgi:hypothetical protein